MSTQVMSNNIETMSSGPETPERQEQSSQIPGAPKKSPAFDILNAFPKIAPIRVNFKVDNKQYLHSDSDEDSDLEEDFPLLVVSPEQAILVPTSTKPSSTNV